VLKYEKNEDIKLIDQILLILSQAGILENLIIAGSWCVYFYIHHFKYEKISRIRTTDIDFDVDLLNNAKNKVDIPELLKPLDFEIKFGGDNYISLVNPSFKIEFISSEIGKSNDKPLNISGFGITAQPLRFLDLLKNEVIVLDYKGLKVNVPHPAWFAVHKFIISQRRKNKDLKTGKIRKDIMQGIEIMGMLIHLGQKDKISEVILKLTEKERKLFKKALQNPEIIDILEMRNLNIILDFV